MYSRSSIIIDNKADNSPVTEADRQAEKAMRDLIKERFPEHGIFGEEFGMQQPNGDSSFLWVLDPIDGTKSFITGMLTKPHCNRCYTDPSIHLTVWVKVRAQVSPIILINYI